MKLGMASSALTLSGSFLPLKHGKTGAVVIILMREEGGRVIVT